MQSCMLHGSVTWPVRKENEVALHWAEMRMVRWMCGVKLQRRIPSQGLWVTVSVLGMLTVNRSTGPQDQDRS